MTWRAMSGRPYRGGDEHGAVGVEHQVVHEADEVAGDLSAGPYTAGARVIGSRRGGGCGSSGHRGTGTLVLYE